MSALYFFTGSKASSRKGETKKGMVKFADTQAEQQMAHLRSLQQLPANPWQGQWYDPYGLGGKGGDQYGFSGKGA